jgi:hypothetical protein
MSGWDVLQILKVILAEERVQAKEAKRQEYLATTSTYDHGEAAALHACVVAHMAEAGLDGGCSDGDY